VDLLLPTLLSSCTLQPSTPPQAPANAVVLWSVPPGLRPLAMSLSVVATHLLGDVPSPPLLGLLQGWLHNWRCVYVTSRRNTAEPGKRFLSHTPRTCWASCPSPPPLGVLQGWLSSLAMDGFGVNAWTRLLHDSPTLCMHRSWCLSAVHAASVSTGAAISGCEAVLCVHRRLSMTLLSTVLLGAVALYMVAMRLARGAPDYRQVQLESPSGEDALEAGTPEEEMPTAALLTQGSASPRFGQ